MLSSFYLALHNAPYILTNTGTNRQIYAHADEEKRLGLGKEQMAPSACGYNLRDSRSRAYVHPWGSEPRLPTQAIRLKTNGLPTQAISF